MKNDYVAKDIQVIEGLNAVRERPGMYIGGTGARGLHHILWEIIDNSMDEIANGFGKSVTVTIFEDNSASVEDDGRGIPVDIHPKLGVSGVEVVFTTLHAGGKFNNNNYTFSGGLHGVGASVTNALSRWLDVTVYKEGKTYCQQFESAPVEGKIMSGRPKAPLKDLNVPTSKHGTLVRFMPDDRVFGGETLRFETIAKHMQDLAFLSKGAILTLIDRRKTDENLDFARESFCYDGGIADLVKFMNESKDLVHNDVVYIEEKQLNFELELAIQYNNGYSETIVSYVNNIQTPEGGTHETGFKSAYTRLLNEYARTRGQLKEKDANLQGEDFREGITAVLSIKMQNVQFEGQTKTKLGNPEAKNLVEGIVYAKLESFFAEKKHFDTGDLIINKALGAAKAREASKKAKDLARQKNSASSNNLVGKLSPCTGKRAEFNELFIVEGDSAGGSAKQGRDRSTQAVLPLKGKPINAEKKRIEQLLANEEICTIISALGAGFDGDFEIKNLKYHKVIILADADQDGGHIRSLVLTFLYRYMKELITEGHVYIGMPPLYKLEKKDVIKYAYNDEELDNCVKEMGKGYKLQRYKGLGEMNPEQLWETTMNPDTRSLMRVSVEDGAAAERLISTLMGDNIEARKQYISKHANFNKTDDFARRG